MYHPKRMLIEALRSHLPISPPPATQASSAADSEDIARLMRLDSMFSDTANRILVMAIRDQEFVTQLLEDRAWWRPLLIMTEDYHERTRLYATAPFSWQKNVALSYSVHPFLQGCAFQVYEHVDDATLDLHFHTLRLTHRDFDGARAAASLLDQQARNGIAERLRKIEALTARSRAAQTPAPLRPRPHRL